MGSCNTSFWWQDSKFGTSQSHTARLYLKKRRKRNGTNVLYDKIYSFLTVSLYNPGCPGDEAGLDPTEIPLPLPHL